MHFLFFSQILFRVSLDEWVRLPVISVKPTMTVR